MAGRASNPISVNQAPQYGDKAALDAFRKNTTTTPMTGNVTPEATAGRPRGRVEEGGAPPAGVPPQLYNKFKQLARAKKTAYFWQQMAETNPSPVTNFFNFHAQEAYQKAAKDVYGSSPNFE